MCSLFSQLRFFRDITPLRMLNLRVCMNSFLSLFNLPYTCYRYYLCCYYSTQFEPLPRSLLHLLKCVHKSLIIDVICVVVDTVADSIIAIHILHQHFVRNLVVWYACYSGFSFLLSFFYYIFFSLFCFIFLIVVILILRVLLFRMYFLFFFFFFFLICK